MMWDFSGGRHHQHPPEMRMPSPSFPVPNHYGGQSEPFPGPPGPSSYPPMPGMAPTYMHAPQYERGIFHGHPPPPPPHHRHAHTYSYELPKFEIPQETQRYERVRAHSHSHLTRPHIPIPPVVKPTTQQPSPRPPPKEHKERKEHKSSHRLKPSHSLPLEPLNPNFQYSKCTGRKKALCIGINYIGQKNELRGCVNDARHVRDFLISHHGYKAGDIVILTDDAKHRRGLPTRRNIIDAMKWLVRSAKTNDSLFFHYSGHGGQTKDLNGDEVDGWDEVIFPMDFRAKGHIIDDEMHDIMVKPLPPGCRLTALFDSCHSGTALDLPYIYSSHGRLRGGMSNSDRRRMATPSDVISWSGCKDGQTSADTFAGGVAVGAMSYAFITSLKRNPKQTYLELLKSIRLILYPRFSQKPQLGSSHKIDTSLQFVL